MIELLRNFYKFVRYATYSPLVHLVPFILAIAVFPICVRLLDVATFALAYLLFFSSYYSLQIFMGYAVFRYMKNIGYFDAVNTYSARSLFWFDISFKNWLEILGIILRKVTKRRTIRSPQQTPFNEFFNIQGLSIADQASKLTKYRCFVHDHKFLYPTVQWRLFQIQEFLARHHIDQQIAAINAQKKKAHQSTAAQKLINWQIVLGVQASTTYEEVKRAYKKLAMKLHPDKGGDTLKFQELQNAWQLAKKHFGVGI